MSVRPCKTCPWRLTTITSAIPGGGLDHAALHLATPDPRGHCRRVMACHLTMDDRPAACAGWALQVARPFVEAEGEVAIPMRLLMLVGGVDVYDFETDVPLHENMAALRAAHPMQEVQAP